MIAALTAAAAGIATTVEAIAAGVTTIITVYGIAKLVVVQLYDSDNEKYRNLKVRCFNINIDPDERGHGSSPEEAIYMLTDELAHSLQDIAAIKISSVNSLQYYKDTPVAENVNQVVEDILTDKGILKNG